MKRKWTRGEKLLWLAPLIFVVGAGAALFGPNVVRRQLGRPIVLETSADSFVTSIALSADGSTLAAATGQLSSRRTKGEQIYSWDARTLAPLPLWSAGTIIDGLFGLALSPDGSAVSRSIFATAGPSNFAVYDHTTQAYRWKISGDFFRSPARFSPDGRTIACARISRRKGRSKKVTESEYLLLRAADGKIAASWNAPSLGVERSLLAWSPDGRTLVCQAVVPAPKSRNNALGIASYQTQIRHASDGKLLQSWPSLPKRSLDISPDGQNLVAVTFHQHPTKIGNTNFQVALFDAATGREKWRYGRGAGKDGESSPYFFTDALFSPDGEVVASVAYSSGKVFLLDSQTGELKRNLSLGNQSSNASYGPSALAWAPDGKRLYARGQNAVLVWNLD